MYFTDADHPYKFTLSYGQAQDYPLDLYYLMDVSFSARHKMYLLENNLVETVANITSNFRLGFGSFVDKAVMPFVSTVPKKK